MRGLAGSLMGAGQYAEAIPFFEEVSANGRSELPASAGCLEQISVCHWMAGDRQAALDSIRELVLAVRDGRITFTDFAGGVSQGLILCYMAITLGSIGDVDLAMNYLKTLASRPRIKNWPGPAAQFLLGGLTFAEAMKNAADTAQTKPEADQEGWKQNYLAAFFLLPEQNAVWPATKPERADSFLNARAFPIHWSNTNGILRRAKRPRRSKRRDLIHPIDLKSR